VAAPNLKIFFHNHCFDGASSAALFADFYRQKQNPEAVIEFCGMSHRTGDPFDSVDIDGEENACVDFRYCKDERMNWWFDHHASAFQPPSLKQHFLATQGSTKFFDPKARSCALFMAGVLKDSFGYEPKDADGHWLDLLTWADRIDGAVFESASEIVELATPVLRVMTWLRGCRDTEAIVRLIKLLGHTSFSALESQPWVADELSLLLKAHKRTTELIARRLVFDGLVACYDLSEDDVQSHSSFAAYMFCPEASYSIGLTRRESVANISIGHNPWAAKSPSHNIAKLCEQYGGGGHPHVGGVAVPAGDMRRPKEIVEEMRRALNRPDGAA
jgi:hypothetical protein